MPPGDDVGGDARVVERDQRLLVDGEVAPPRPRLQLLDVLQEGPVGVEEGVAGVPVALDERVADEQVAGGLGVDAAVVDAAVDHDRHAVQRHPLDARRRRRACATSAAPNMSVLTRCPASGSIHSGWIFATVRANSRDVSTSSAAITQRGFFLASGEPGKIMKWAPRAPRYSRVSPSRRPIWESRPDSTAMWILSGDGVGVVRGEARVAGGLAQLRVQVLPFADAQEVQELGAQLLAEPAAGQGFPALGDVPPQVEVGEEVRAVGGEAGVLLVGGLALLDGPLARVLHRQRGRDHQHLAQAAGAVGLDEHAAEAGVDRQRGQRAADGG